MKKNSTQVIEMIEQAPQNENGVTLLSPPTRAVILRKLRVIDQRDEENQQPRERKPKRAKKTKSRKVIR